jgi:hypothetical protein
MPIITKKESEDKMNPDQVRLMNGVMLGKGRIDVSKNIIQLRTNEGKFVHWLADEFSSVGGRVVETGEKVEFRTGRYSWVEKWHDRWYYRNKKVVPRGLSLSPLMAGVWFYQRGSVHETHGRVKFDMNGMRASARNAQEILESAGFETFESFGHIEMAEGIGKRFLEWIERPPQLF